MGMLCWCDPKLMEDEDGDIVQVIHNDFDT